MNTSSQHLFPVYAEGSNTSVFFVDPATVPPAIVSHAKDDDYGRKGHETQFLKVPLDVPNYMGLCHEPGQKPWTPMDEIDGARMRVLSLLVHQVSEGGKSFFIPTQSMTNTSFVQSPEGNHLYLLNLRMLHYGGFNVENFAHEKVGEELFANFKAAGFEPLFNISMAGSYDRQRNRLRLTDNSSKLSGLRNIETLEYISPDKATQEQLALMKSVKGVFVGGTRLHQVLK